MTQLLLFNKPKQRKRREVTPTDPHVEAQDVRRLTRQALAIIERLKRGPATNLELSRIALRYGARLKDARSAGYQIECIRGEGGLHIYRLTNRTNACANHAASNSSDEMADLC